MEGQEIPQFSKESKEEFTELLLNFFRKHLSEEACSSIIVEVKLNSQSQSRELQEPQRVLLQSGCFPGTSSFGCRPGYHWETQSL